MLRRKPSTMHFRLLFLSLIIRCSGASSDINFQDGEFMSYTFGTEPKSAFLTSEPQNGGADHQFGLVTAETPFAALGSSEANIIQSNNDECGPYDPAPSSRKMRSKRESPRICYPPSARRNSPPSVQGTGSHNPSEKDPKDSTEKDSQGNAQQQPSRNFAPAEGSDCATIPSAPLSVCAVVNADHIRHDLVVPMSGISSGWWQLEYSRGGTHNLPYPLF